MIELTGDICIAFVMVTLIVSLLIAYCVDKVCNLVESILVAFRYAVEDYNEKLLELSRRIENSKPDLSCCGETGETEVSWRDETTKTTVNNTSHNVDKG